MEPFDLAFSVFACYHGSFIRTTAVAVQLLAARRIYHISIFIKVTGIRELH